MSRNPRTLAFRSLLTVSALSFLLALMPTTLSAQGGAGGGGHSGGNDSGGGNGGPQDTGSLKEKGNTGATKESPAKDHGASRPQDGLTESSGRELRSLADWFRSSSDARYLEGISESIVRQADESARAGVPPELFLARLKEAVAKKVSPSQVAAGIALDVSNWKFIAAAVSDGLWLPSKTRNSFFLTMGTSMRNGFPQATVQNSILWARTNGIPPERLASAVAAVTGLPSVKENPSNVGLRLSKAFAASKLKTEQFAEAVSALQAALVRGASMEPSLQIIEKLLSGGGTLSELKSKLSS